MIQNDPVHELLVALTRFGRRASSPHMNAGEAAMYEQKLISTVLNKMYHWRDRLTLDFGPPYHDLAAFRVDFTHPLHGRLLTLLSNMDHKQLRKELETMVENSNEDELWEVRMADEYHSEFCREYLRWMVQWADLISVDATDYDSPRDMCAVSRFQKVLDLAEYWEYAGGMRDEITAATSLIRATRSRGYDSYDLMKPVADAVFKSIPLHDSVGNETMTPEQWLYMSKFIWTWELWQPEVLERA